MNMKAKIFFLGTAAIAFVISLPSATATSRCSSCIIKGALKDTRNDIYADELEVEDPALSSQRRKLEVKVRPVQRCGSGLCRSRNVKVLATSRNGKLKKCIRRRGSTQFICKPPRRAFEIRVLWKTNRRPYRRTLSLVKTPYMWINRAVSIKAIMPRVKYQRLSLLSLSKVVVITEAIQGKTCPNERRRYPLGSKQDLAERTLDGRLNNPKRIFSGAAGEKLIRLSGNGFADKVFVPAGACSEEQRAGNTCPFPEENNGTGSNRPNPRVISNTLLRQNRNFYSRRGLSDLIVYFGQFLDHDTTLTEELPRTFVHKRPNDFDVDFRIPKGDIIFDRDSKGNETLHVRRFMFDGCTGEEHNKPRQLTASISAVLDANTIYGSDLKRLNLLRTNKDGLMKTDGRNFLPLNTFGLKMTNNIQRDPTKLRAAGDVRANESPTLHVLHTLFVREHNRIAKQYKKKHRRATDEEVFQYARKMVIAEIQAITFREYIPSILGRPLPRYRGYNPKINTGIATEFSTATFRYGHTQINSKVFRFQKNGKVSPYGHLLLREGFFRPERVTEEGGLDPILRGAVRQPSQEIDTNIVDELRNFLFLNKGASLDLAAINIQRGRETGIPDYNTVRKKLGLKRVKSFKQITRNRKVAKILKSLYKNVNNLDLWVAGIAEDHVRGSELGPTFEKIFRNQLTRIRDGDRFWYTRILSRKEIRQVHRNTLSRIIRLNTGFKNPPKRVFFSIDRCRGVKKFQCVPR